jgi:hypothetical protein
VRFDANGKWVRLNLPLWNREAALGIIFAEGSNADDKRY